MLSRFGRGKETKSRYLALIVMLIIVLLAAWPLYLRWFEGRAAEDWVGIDDYNGPKLQDGQVFRLEDGQVFQRRKTLWDLFEVLILPVVVSVGAALFDRAQSKRDREQALEQSRDATLRNYLEYLSGLLLDKNLREQNENSDQRILARARTLAILPSLDSGRKAVILRFLYEAGLIGNRLDAKPIIGLSGADFSDVNMQGQDLGGASLIGVDLRGADFSDAELGLEPRDFPINIKASGEGLTIGGKGANFVGANLENACFQNARLARAAFKHANLTNTNFRNAKLQDSNMMETVLVKADFTRADLSLVSLYGANLKGAVISSEQLKTVSELAKAVLPDGSVYKE